MKRIIYLTFYFEPDLSACSFRNSTLAKVLSELIKDKNCVVEVYTTMPSRYNTYSAEALGYEELGNLRIHRIKLPRHGSGMRDQIISYFTYFRNVLRLCKGKNVSLVFVSSGRLFSTLLGYILAKKNRAPLYLDIRDIFVDTLEDVLKSRWIKMAILPFLKLIEHLTFSYATHINLISGGFKLYFSKYRKANFTEFTNGIDDDFLKNEIDLSLQKTNGGSIKTIIYAGNIGEGQGLHKIIPQAALRLGNSYRFLIIGDGGAKTKLVREIEMSKIENIEIKNPVDRKSLIFEYMNADFLFIHLNNYTAFEKVLPSKIFELSTFPKPIIAGVTGYAKYFLESEMSNVFVFYPCDVDTFVSLVENYKFEKEDTRADFIKKYKRGNINIAMANSIIQYI